MKIPIISKMNDKITKITSDLNTLGDSVVDILGEANKNISDSLKEATEDIRGTADNISQSVGVMSDSLSQATEEFKGTAQSIEKSADTITKAVETFTTTTTTTVDRFERAIEKSIDRLISTIQDFKKEMVDGGIKVNIAKSAGSLMPRPDGVVQGLRDMIIPKRKQKDYNE